MVFFVKWWFVPMQWSKIAGNTRKTRSNCVEFHLFYFIWFQRMGHIVGTEKTERFWSLKLITFSIGLVFSHSVVYVSFGFHFSFFILLIFNLIFSSNRSSPNQIVLCAFIWATHTRNKFICGKYIKWIYINATKTKIKPKLPQPNE